MCHGTPRSIFKENYQAFTLPKDISEIPTNLTKNYLPPLGFLSHHVRMA